MKKILIALIAAFGLTACGTLAGIGKDISSLGDLFQSKAEAKPAAKAPVKK